MLRVNRVVVACVRFRGWMWVVAEEEGRRAGLEKFTRRVETSHATRHAPVRCPGVCMQDNDNAHNGRRRGRRACEVGGRGEQRRAARKGREDVQFAGSTAESFGQSAAGMGFA